MDSKNKEMRLAVIRVMLTEAKMMMKPRITTESMLFRRYNPVGYFERVSKNRVNILKITQ